MALTLADIIQPKGEINKTWLPAVDGVTADDMINEWLDKHKTENEDIQRAYVYYRAYSLICNTALLEPARQRRVDSEDQYLENQLKYFQDLRDRAKACYETELSKLNPSTSSTVFAGVAM